MAGKDSDIALTPEEVLKDADRRMLQAVEFLKRELNSVRTGRAAPSLVENVSVDYYGAPTPLKQLATLSAPEAQLILIQPFDRSAIRAIEKAIQTSAMGLNPSNDGSVVRIPIPPLSQERRKELVKTVGRMVEEGKVAARNVRRDALDKLRTLERNKDISEDEEKRAEAQLQKATDTHISEMDQLAESKNKELMTV